MGSLREARGGAGVERSDLAGSDGNVRGVLDSHVHFWDPQRLRYPWLAGEPALNRAFLPVDLAAARRSAAGSWSSRPTVRRTRPSPRSTG